ncbi:MULTISPECIES: SDR family NAD(P)-dependent oxidoreductase [Roseivirga]|uniref:Oxidoreductase n=1 Tax=Roseivirga spongicola TaxID=333140 RepID=A0A150X5X3_9BACT|nr:MULTISPECIES: SDR family oxidoreductase [Roseivirga]KYG74110.1 oxidoreductase [Roseivirga spongicola]MBO6660424.1 SDR family oxidoreductase [Roseivirga sp.]MBO6761404.1 SDR family oxidoreductase [Roseivirga sp.]MBO6906839.1 SDR family oxidoreductase [Roseivirga sp.]WPZ09237.1 SDR family oxidoreductase [Roseivirga spongicola]
MKDKTILVFGASSGIGKATAQALIDQGANVISASRSNPEISGLEHHSFDATDKNAELDFIPEQLDGLVYCPGTINLKPFNRSSIEDFQSDLDINLLGAIRVLQASFKSLKKSDSASVVLFSTVAAKLGMNFHSSIATAKAAVEGLGKSLAAEWSMHGIRVNMVAPSLTDTPLAEKLLSTDDRKESSNKRHPIGRYGEAKDLSEMVVFLLSEKASWVTGQTIGIDGGVGSLKP